MEVFGISENKSYDFPVQSWLHFGELTVFCRAFRTYWHLPMLDIGVRGTRRYHGSIYPPRAPATVANKVCLGSTY